jgi:Zn-dependent membrane protease YugP
MLKLGVEYVGLYLVHLGEHDIPLPLPLINLSFVLFPLLGEFLHNVGLVLLGAVYQKVYFVFDFLKIPIVFDNTFKVILSFVEYSEHLSSCSLVI